MASFSSLSEFSPATPSLQDTGIRAHVLAQPVNGVKDVTLDETTSRTAQELICHNFFQLEDKVIPGFVVEA